MRLKKKNLHLNQEIEQHYSFRKLASGVLVLEVKATLKTVLTSPT